MSQNKDEFKNGLVQEINNVSKEGEENLAKLVQKVIKNDEVDLHISTEALDFKNARYFEVTEKDKVYKTVTLPITGKKYSFMSNLSLVFDSHNEITNYAETFMTKSEDNKFKVQIYMDGQLTKDEVTDVEYISDSELKQGVDELETITQDNQTEGVGAVASCIAGIAGVNIGVAYALVAACAGSCPAVPPICIACIGAVATVGVGDVKGVVACFNLL